jgi:alpha-1,6-mannosyltransferase
MKIVRVANFVMARSGGLRTALGCLGAGYLAAGHDPILVVPGERFADEQTEMGRVIKLPGPELPGTGGYRVLVDRRRVAAQLDRLGPDRLEVSDRTTLRWTGQWARHVGFQASSSRMRASPASCSLPGTWALTCRCIQRPHGSFVRHRGLHDQLGGGGIPQDRGAEPSAGPTRCRSDDFPSRPAR